VLEIRTGREIGITTDDASVTSIAFSPDEKFIALGDDNGTVRVWDILTGQEIIRFKNQYSIISIGFSSDNTHIVSIDIYGNVRYREWPLNNLIEYACIVAQHNLTRAEWNQYIGDVLPYQAVCPNLPVESESAP